MTVSDLADAVKADVATDDWTARLQTMLLAAGLVGVGFLLGVEAYATVVQVELAGLPLMEGVDIRSTLQARYRALAMVGSGCAAIGLLGGVWLHSNGTEGEA